MITFYGLEGQLLLANWTLRKVSLLFLPFLNAWETKEGLLALDAILWISIQAIVVTNAALNLVDQLLLNLLLGLDLQGVFFENNLLEAHGVIQHGR